MCRRRLCRQNGPMTALQPFFCHAPAGSVFMFTPFLEQFFIHESHLLPRAGHRTTVCPSWRGIWKHRMQADNFFLTFQHFKPALFSQTSNPTASLCGEQFFDHVAGCVDRNRNYYDIRPGASSAFVSLVSRSEIKILKMFLLKTSKKASYFTFAANYADCDFVYLVHFSCKISALHELFLRFTHRFLSFRLAFLLYEFLVFLRFKKSLQLWNISSPIPERIFYQSTPLPPFLSSFLILSRGLCLFGSKQHTDTRAGKKADYRTKFPRAILFFVNDILVIQVQRKYIKQPGRLEPKQIGHTASCHRRPRFTYQRVDFYEVILFRSTRTLSTTAVAGMSGYGWPCVPGIAISVASKTFSKLACSRCCRV